jgi:hypothetical protein
MRFTPSSSRLLRSVELLDPRARFPSGTQSPSWNASAQACSGANLRTVSEDERDQERDDRDRERSDEAHWRVAEEGAEDKDDGPKQKTEKSQEDTRTADR